MTLKSILQAVGLVARPAPDVSHEPLVSEVAAYARETNQRLDQIERDSEDMAETLAAAVHTVEEYHDTHVMIKRAPA